VMVAFLVGHDDIVFDADMAIHGFLAEFRGFNLEIISFSIRLNLAAVIGVVLGIFVFFKV